jgi:DNA polymerase III delta subunit
LEIKLKAAKYSQGTTYRDYLESLKGYSTFKEVESFPKLSVVFGPSLYLRQRAMQSVAKSWSSLGDNTAQFFEASDFDEARFRSLWGQVSLFEPVSLSVLKRSAAVKSLHLWLKAIPATSEMKSHILLDLGDHKVTADLQKQLKRLNACEIPCHEPDAIADFHKITLALARRYKITIDDECAQLLLDAVGPDLSKIENEITNWSLIFAGQNRPLTRQDIAGLTGAVREDDVFELFTALRKKHFVGSNLLLDSFIARGESAVALNGILARFARDQIEKGALNSGLAGIKSCAAVDRKVKSSGIDESLLLSAVIQSISDGCEAI